jgi:uncharacterized protein YjbI with pentapeptide repeats
MADFSGADLRGSLFEGANLTGSEFRTADLAGARFRNVDMSRVYAERDLATLEAQVWAGGGR